MCLHVVFSAKFACRLCEICLETILGCFISYVSPIALSNTPSALDVLTSCKKSVMIFLMNCHARL